MIKFQKLEFDPDKVFFSSDFHWGHKNITKDSTWDRPIEGENVRPFTLEQMNKDILTKINDTVPWDGLLIHGGDWSFGGQEKVVAFRRSIVCDNIITAIGNHDHNILRFTDLRDLFLMKEHILYLKVEHQDILLCHYPIVSFPGINKEAWMLHGHCHGNLKDNPDMKILDIGWDTKLYGHQQYTLYSFRELQEIMKQKQFKPVDHHADI